MKIASSATVAPSFYGGLRGKYTLRCRFFYRIMYRNLVPFFGRKWLVCIELLGEGLQGVAFIRNGTRFYGCATLPLNYSSIKQCSLKFWVDIEVLPTLPALGTKP